MSLALALAGALAGLVAGSFIGVIGERWPRGEQVVSGRSRCEACARTLTPADLVPLASYAVLRGKCRHCGAPIPAHLPVVELLAAIVGAAVFAVADRPLELFWALFGWMLLALALLDWRALWLPRRLTLTLLAFGLAYHAAAGDRQSFLFALCGAAAGWAALALVAIGYERLRGRRGLGRGDPKLFAAIGAWLGAGALAPVVSFASLGGLAFVFGAMAGGRQITSDTRLPFGTFLALGAALYWAVASLSQLPLPFTVEVP
ncbi:hypothetical protein B5C34_01660 [Pacificimonas flava]|uniref:Prepilin leader peptidase/N-methyltransferase n=2 Tax=Pacificimonas TaxID=1960290 RepID=A0A219B2D1_9SPHN|nr:MULTISPECIES: A24 family peptidase [Pacificimonas]MBZ6378076.1 prepilin peptidase [Pacificimonas aurantium]OWV32283.1 hypothetical protein B5C34_01660 [Pacificimonas flava]